MSGSDVFNLATALYCHARLSPARMALVVEEREYSYAGLAHHAGRVACWLGRGVEGRGLRVGILAGRSLETYAGILGTAWAGGTYVPLNPKQPAARMGVIMRRAGLNAVIAWHGFSTCASDSSTG